MSIDNDDDDKGRRAEMIERTLFPESGDHVTWAFVKKVKVKFYTNVKPPVQKFWWGANWAPIGKNMAPIG